MPYSYQFMDELLELLNFSLPERVRRSKSSCLLIVAIAGFVKEAHALSCNKKPFYRAF